MKTRIITTITILTLIMSCSSTKSPSPKVWAWVSGSLTMTDETLEHYFSKCKEVGIEHEDLMDVQNGTNSPCNVDIYVVRPVLRNPGEEDGQIYYLIMNDVPWTTDLN